MDAGGRAETGPVTAASRLASVVGTSSEGLPGCAGMRLVEDLGVVQRYEAIDGEGVPVSVLMLGDRASRDPQQRAAFVQQAVQASVAALPGQSPITLDANRPRPWAASRQEQGAVGVERLLPGVLAQSPRGGVPPWVVAPSAPQSIPQSGTHHVPRPAATTTLLPTELPPLPSIVVPEAPPRLAGPRPTLKDVPPVTVLGPSPAPGGGDTHTFDFPGWP